MPPLVTLITDFGTRDPYVGTMKGVLFSADPQTSVVDLTHDIQRHQLSSAGFWIDRCHGYFPADTVHVVVVDPGVGTNRQGLALRAGGQFFIGPDNAIFSDVLLRHGEEATAVRLDRSLINPTGRRGTTFDGRDLFAPAAARLSKTKDLESLGQPVAIATLNQHDVAPDPLRPRIRVVDHYGNLITDCPTPQDEALQVCVFDRVLDWAKTYGSAPDETPVAIRGSWGTIEVAVNQGSAQQLLGLQVGDRLSLVG